jgi:hypothetical protein
VSGEFFEATLQNAAIAKPEISICVRISERSIKCNIQYLFDNCFCFVDLHVVGNLYEIIKDKIILPVVDSHLMEAQEPLKLWGVVEITTFARNGTY